MSARGEEVVLAVLHAVPPLIGTVWFQTLGVEGLPGGPLPWLAVLYATAPIAALALAARRERGLKLALYHGVVISLLAAAFAWHPPVAMTARGWARLLATLALACGGAIAILAARLSRRGPGVAERDARS